MIILKNVNKIYHQKKHSIEALKDINLEIAKGEIYGVIGSSGAGKSTLIRCVNMLESPSSGQVIVDGTDVTKLKDYALIKHRRQIGMIFQHFNLLSSRTVFGNVALALEFNGETNKEKINKRVFELLELVGLADKHASYPANLSGGQKQRVAIARALATEPKVLLCDEATSALDPATTSSILSLLKDINRRLNITILLITHEMDVVKKICDKVGVISQGQLIEQGTVAELFSHPKTPLAKSFIESTIDIEIPDDYQAKLQSTEVAGKHPLLKLTFTGRSVDAPVLSEIAQRYGILSNIISARMDYAGGVKFGVMLAEFSGENSKLELAIAFLREQHVKIEELGYV
ncbi:methionine ABC transporter ATP-binding protein MetN [Thorsellia anophelis]|uniref:D-methionine transport system ATP-binding protein n=1 Tax=Thorsellia anophelis DSM 18579 TaxID=1123402 RepID=A0A1I0EVB0_9GAMM|nr:methionine ABC transporter ATP-binding protein MetN [Thorsellia anophelis]SET49395.1 D-methionine transport system ATP-binding protein [Thorsellia anophelis DSM 18579]